MNLAKTFLAIGIAVIFAVFVGYGLHVVYEVPKNPFDVSRDESCYKTYNCNQQLDQCRKPGDYAFIPKDKECYSAVKQSTEYKTCEELQDKCIEEFNKRTPLYIHAKNSFYILIGIGLVAIIAGIFLTRLQGIGSGLIGGGVLIVLWSLIYTQSYWVLLNEYVKLGALGIVLIVLIYLGYKKLEKKSGLPD